MADRDIPTMKRRIARIEDALRRLLVLAAMDVVSNEMKRDIRREVHDLRFERDSLQAIIDETENPMPEDEP